MGANDAGAAVGALLSGHAWADPYPVYDAIRTHGPLVQVQNHFYVAGGYAVADAVLRDPRMLVADNELTQLQAGDQEDVLGASMLRANPPDHARVRRLAAGAFTPRRIEAMRGAVTEQATTLARYLAHLGKRGEVFDFVSEFAYPLPIRVICALLGVPGEDQHWFREQATALTAALEPVLRDDELDAAVRARSRLGLYFADLVARRREHPRDDLVTALVQVHDTDGSRLSRDELIANLILLLVAGFETTTNLLGNGLAVLLERPGLVGALRADPAAFVEEVLRYDAPVQMTARWCREEVVVGAGRGEAVGGPAKIEPYSQVLVLLGAANRDPARYPRPDIFDPARPASAPLSFGAGGHYCLGAALARMEAQIALPLLVELLPRLALAGPPLRRPRLTLRGYVEIPVTA